MQGEAKVGSDRRELRIGDHRLGPAAVLLRRLKQQHGAAAPRAFGGEAVRDRGEDRHVAVVAAEVRAA